MLKLPVAKVSFESKCLAYLSAVHMRDGVITNRAASSGFFWRNGPRVYLITARHCITGRNQCNEPLPDSFDPTHLQIYFRNPGLEVQPDARQYTNKRTAAQLWRDGEPDWLEHDLGPLVDVVALDFTSAGHEVHCVNDRQQIEEWELEAGADCLIVGFPDALAGSQGTPIWKRASIASEPNLEFEGLPLFLCDSATRKGLSGAPVFAKLQGNFGQHGSQFKENGPPIFGSWTKFIGIYTGRNGDENDGFQLGRVWKTEVVEQIVKSQKKAQSSFAVSARP